MKESQRIAKNLVVIVSSQLIGYGLNFFILILIARYLGTVGFGNYSFIIAFVSIFQLFVDSGISYVLTREVAINKDNLKFYLGVLKPLIWVLSIIVYLIIVLILNFLELESSVKNSTYIMGIAVIATIHALFYNAIFRAMEEMEYNAIGFILHKILLLSLVFYVIKKDYSLEGIILSFLISNVILWFYYYTIVCYKYHRPKMIINIKTWKYFFKEGFPIGISTIIRKISWQIDILILSLFSTPVSVGLFSAPYKIIQSMDMLSHSLSIPFYPFFSRVAKKSHKELFYVYEQSLKFMYVVSVPIVVILVTFSHSIVSMLFGNSFLNAHVALQILGLTLLFLFPTAQFFYLFSSLNKQKLYTLSSLTCLTINIILDVILVPKIDFIGACIGTLTAEALLLLICIYFVKSIDKNIKFMKIVWKPCISGILMWSILIQFKGVSIMWMISGIILGLLSFGLSILFLKTFSSKEISTFKESIRFMSKKTPSVA